MSLNSNKRAGWILFFVLLCFHQYSVAEFKVGSANDVVRDLREHSVTSTLLATSILGKDVRVLNVRHTGARKQAGFISGYGHAGIENGVVLSNGAVSSILGPNSSDRSSDVIFDLNIEDRDFFQLNNRHFTRDESIIELDFIPLVGQTQISINYVFGSDEYDASMSAISNVPHDFMAILVNGVNCAQVNGNKVGVETINNVSNSELYIDNVRRLNSLTSTMDSPHNTEMDGFSVVLTCTAAVRPGERNHLEFGVVDAGTGFVKSHINSWMILESIDTDRLIDSDNDGIPNYLDPDDDNDGIPDDVEGGNDVDGDGLPNSLDDDSDGDGVLDSEECPDSSACTDSDGDEIPDFVDIADHGNGPGDSDNDGIPDDIECPDYANGCPNHDDDLIPDYSDQDSDNDGASDSEECSDYLAGCADSDGDGAPGYLDSIDNDDDADDQDTDGDGISDRDECPIEQSCPDTDGDGIPDYLDNENNTDPRAVGGGSAGSDERVKVGLNGVGAFNEYLLSLLLLVAALRIFSFLRVRATFRSFTFITSTCLLGLVLSRSHDVVAAENADGEQGKFYVLGAFGPTWLEPETDTSPYLLDDDKSFGFKLAAGYDLLDQVSIEASIARLGKATLLPEGEVEYNPYAVSVLYHLLGQRSRSVFVKAGLASINTSSDVPTDTVNDYQLMLGLGTEWAWRNGWSLRAEFESYDKDASQFSVGVVKRFARKTEHLAENPKAQPVAVLAETTKKDLCKNVTSDSHCHMPPIAEQKHSCAVVSGRIEGIHFETNKAALTPSAVSVLNEAAEVLRFCPSFSVEIQAHADSVGTKERNLVLSRHRAQAVRLHLVARGIAPSRLIAHGYGELAPVADNNTPEGRALNRRVEFNMKQIHASERLSAD